MTRDGFNNVREPPRFSAYFISLLVVAPSMESSFGLIFFYLSCFFYLEVLKISSCIMTKSIPILKLDYIIWKWLLNSIIQRTFSNYIFSNFSSWKIIYRLYNLKDTLTLHNLKCFLLKKIMV